MISKEEYKKTLIRMWDSVREGYTKGEYNCNGVECEKCPIESMCGSGVVNMRNSHEIIEFVERWAKEHPIETNGSRFLKNYPKAVVYKYDSNDDGFVYLGLDCTKPFNDENGTKFPTRWWESEVDDANCD